ncbi:hypothetical protein AYR54_03695 [Loigolactobacillus backii]|uniref:DUF3278 domain-containing protein n=1 Tax=Loigolactobacillus backii TaxID=375175 RepID=UPI0007F17132|nr:DUF3278 domain-containing protein [Loigolactobacillus backii]ANK59422.1 hypothetical protein AYR52_03685 [Loigolactobacillus backii]ANK64415.1 hypothetical protein AYR54_03695 [Loigolactobacillus backii]ANK67190.1 hypothetical protein AYR55_05345 [Loigolactobacillus backii]OLF69446.1 hypothetical protein ACX53_08020 [Loigolactobacillus backii]PIO87834.1 hypothetical protein B8A32_12100 [Loigolactobacillus backii]
MRKRLYQWFVGVSEERDERQLSELHRTMADCLLGIYIISLVYLGARCIYIVVNQTSFPLDLVAILILTLAISGYMGFQIIYHRLDEVDVQNRDQLKVKRRRLLLKSGCQAGYFALGLFGLDVFFGSQINGHMIFGHIIGGVIFGLLMYAIGRWRYRL